MFLLQISPSNDIIILTELKSAEQGRKKMIKEIVLNDRKIQYNLQYKKVKNINLRIKADKTVNVSANLFVSQKAIEKFLLSKSDFIIKALEKEKTLVKKQYFTEDEICDVILKLCKSVYPYFEEKGIKYPLIKFRKMVSQWGNCNFVKGVLTFNTALMYAPPECIEYVVMHEFTHFIVKNHSKSFYEELSKICPQWKSRKKELSEIFIR